MGGGVLTSGPCNRQIAVKMRLEPTRSAQATVTSSWAIVHAQLLGRPPSSLGDEALDDGDHLVGVQRSSLAVPLAMARASGPVLLVDDVQQFQLPAIGGLVELEVERPDVVHGRVTEEAPAQQARRRRAGGHPQPREMLATIADTGPGGAGPRHATGRCVRLRPRLDGEAVLRRRSRMECAVFQPLADRDGPSGDGPEPPANPCPPPPGRAQRPRGARRWVDRWWPSTSDRPDVRKNPEALRQDHHGPTTALRGPWTRRPLSQLPHQGHPRIALSSSAGSASSFFSRAFSNASATRSPSPLVRRLVSLHAPVLGSPAVPGALGDAEGLRRTTSDVMSLPSLSSSSLALSEELAHDLLGGVSVSFMW